MKHLKTSLIVLAGVLAAIGMVTLFIPSLTQAQKSGATQNREFSLGGTSGFGDNSVYFPLTGPDSEGTSYAITSLTVANGSASDSYGALVLEVGTPINGCFALAPGAQTLGPRVSVPAGETVHIIFPQPFVLSVRPGPVSGPYICLKAGTDNLNVSFTVVGYKL